MKTPPADIGHRSQIKSRQLFATVDPVDICFVNCVTKQSNPKIADANDVFLHSLLSHLKIIISKQRIKSKIDVLQLIDGICEPPEDGSFEASSSLLQYLPISQTSHLQCSTAPLTMSQSSNSIPTCI
jgi:hypothetical protein